MMRNICKLALIVTLVFVTSYVNGSLKKSIVASRHSHNVEPPVQFIFTEVEWLIPTNNAFIEFDWYINEMTAVSVTFCKMKNNGSLFVCGKVNNYSDKPPYTFNLQYATDSRGFVYWISSNTRINQGIGIGQCGISNFGQWGTLQYVNDNGDRTSEFYVNGQLVSTYTSFYPTYVLPTQPLLFLAEYNNTTDPKTGIGQFTSDAIRVAHGAFWRNGELYQDLIPVRFTNETGELEGAFWCRVQNQLYRNVRVDGYFIIGPDKVEE